MIAADCGDDTDLRPNKSDGAVDHFLGDVDPGGYAIVNRHWRYIHYADGTEELYDLAADPHEWFNLAAKAEHQAVIAELRRSAPEQFAPAGPDASELRLVAEGERFRWEPKPAKAKAAN